MSDKILDRYRRLVELSRDLASTLELDALLNRIVKAATEISESEAASILLYEERHKQLFFQASTNLDSPMMGGLRVPLDSIAGWIVTHKKPLVIADVSQDSRFFGGIAKATNFQSRSILGVPLITKDKTVGVLEALNKLEGTFTEEDQEMLMVLGAQAAVAIENTRLFLQSDLISEMVHELRTPLASLNSATYLLLRPELKTEQFQKMVGIIQGETRRLSEMATSFLDLSRLESGRAQFIPEELNLTNLLVECANITYSNMVERSINFLWNPPKNLPFIYGDKDKLKQVFLNLLSNAVKYNSPEGTLEMKAGISRGRVSVSIKDTGPGIPKESMGNLFKKFYRVPGTEKLAQGTGLGLSIVKKIVEAHNGEIKIKSRVGKGTTFTVYIPYRRELAKAEPAL
ncbi:MAG TPA: GAF domain-containing sensor histidine kinase [Anaerolineales bacterium]|nr:GAF domain-containing sensor histidine kinase [Anaerolineales bacterium]